MCLTAAEVISQYIDDVYIFCNWNKVPTGSHLPLHYEKNESDDVKLFYFNILYQFYQ